MIMKDLSWRDHLIGVLLMVGYMVVLMNTARDLGMSRDEGFYVNAAQAYAHFFEVLAEDSNRALSRDFIDRIWSNNHEHPPLVKSVFAWSYLVQRKWEIFPFPSLSYRFGGMLSAGLLLWLTYIFGARLFGRSAGIFAALVLALIPRLFYHSHLAAFDVPIVLMTTWVSYAYWRSLTSRWWAVITGIAYGLALCTKHNSWALPWIFFIHFLWVAVCELISRKREGQKRLSLFPWWMLWMTLLGPLIFIGAWPWLWNDTLARIADYVAFHTQHVYYNMAYFGVNYFRPPFPASYPWVMTLYTVPVTTVLLCIVGCVLLVRGWLSRRRNLQMEEQTDPRQHVVLLGGCLLAPLVMISLPSTPIFGGTKHWLTAYPFLALFAGLGFMRIADICKVYLPKIHPRLVSISCALVLLFPSLIETEHSHPFGLSHYGIAAGGVPGAADHGMNRQFWGYTTGSLVDFFNANLPHGGKVWICDTTVTSWRMLIEDGLLNANISSVSDIPSADYAIVHHEHHFAEVDYQIWNTYGSVRPVYVLLYDGVPLISVYKNPQSTHATGTLSPHSSSYPRPSYGVAQPVWKW